MKNEKSRMLVATLLAAIAGSTSTPVRADEEVSFYWGSLQGHFSFSDSFHGIEVTAADLTSFAMSSATPSGGMAAWSWNASQGPIESNFNFNWNYYTYAFASGGTETSSMGQKWDTVDGSGPNPALGYQSGILTQFIVLPGETVAAASVGPRSALTGLVSMSVTELRSIPPFAAPVPEPSTFALFLAGLLGFAGIAACRNLVRARRQAVGQR